MRHMPGRARFIDMARGVLIVYIVLYHLLYDLTVFFGVPMPFFWGGCFQATRVAAVMALLYISGMVSECTRNGLRRAGKLAVCAAAITVASLAALPDSPIYFGIIHLYAACALAYLPAGRFIKVSARRTGAALCLLAFAVSYNIPNGYMQFGGLVLALPRGLYEAGLLAPLGFPPGGFSSSDYYPFLPWAWVFFAGAFYAKPLRAGDMPGYVYSPTRLPLLERIGRHTLAIYLIHQPVFISILYLIFRGLY